MDLNWITTKLQFTHGLLPSQPVFKLQIQSGVEGTAQKSER